MYLSNATLFDCRDVYRIYYVKNNYMFRHFTMAIFRLRNEKIKQLYSTYVGCIQLYTAHISRVQLLTFLISQPEDDHCEVPKHVVVLYVVNSIHISTIKQSCGIQVHRLQSTFFVFVIYLLNQSSKTGEKQFVQHLTFLHQFPLLCQHMLFGFDADCHRDPHNSMIIKFRESIRLINSVLEWKQNLKYDCGQHFENSYPEIDFEQHHNHTNGPVLFDEYISLYKIWCFQD